jgi:uncharacterized protein YndB with AHSA1/START domain
VKILKVVFYSAAALVGLLLLVGLFLPTTAHVERSIATGASPATVYDIVSDFRRFNEWSPWFGLDPQAKYTYEGPDGGVGARMRWAGDPATVGTGSQEITAVDPGRSVTTRLDFGDQGQATARITIEPDGAGSRVTWAFDTSFEGDFLGRYFGLLFDRWIGADYEKGLAKLKTVAEATPAAN